MTERHISTPQEKILNRTPEYIIFREPEIENSIANVKKEFEEKKETLTPEARLLITKGLEIKESENIHEVSNQGWRYSPKKEPNIKESKTWNLEIARREIKKRVKNQVGELQEIQSQIGDRRIRPFWEYKFNVNEKKLMGVGDLHYKTLGSDVKYFEGTIDYIKKTNTAIILMGDMLENATRYSIGAGVYEQYIPPMEQLYDVCEMLSPIKKQILAVICGNHEYRTFKESGFNPAQIMADKLSAPYCGFETFLRIWAKKQKYIIYGTHGATGARFAWTKMKALDDLMRYINADVIMYGHTHDTLIKKTTTKGLIDKKKFGILTGSFLRDEPHSYAVMKCYPPAEVGVVKVKLFGDRWDIHCSK